MNTLSLVMFLGSAGLGDLQKTLVSNWIGPAFFIVVAGFAIKFIISRQFRELAGFLGIATVVGLLIFYSSGLFGTDGVFYKIAKSLSGDLDNGGSATGANVDAAGMIGFLKNFEFRLW